MASKIHSKYDNITVENISTWKLSQLNDLYRALTDIQYRGFNGSSSAFSSAFGEVKFNPVQLGSLGRDSKGQFVPANAENWNGTINVTPNADWNNFIHEMGNLLDGRAKRSAKNAPLYSQVFVDQFNTGSCTVSPCTDGGWTPSGITTVYGQVSPMEDFADSFLAVIKYGGNANQHVDVPRVTLVQALMQSYVDYNPYLGDQ